MSKTNQGLQHIIKKCIECDNKFNIFTEILKDKPLFREKPSSKLLKGIPIAVKDNISIKGHRLTNASRMLSDFISPYNATVINKILDAGGVIIGKTNMDEFGMGSSSEYSIFGPVKNTLDINKTCGGSSGGSAAAIASGCAPIALGSDTGGSARQPASFCGIYALKPTYGRVSRFGLTEFASSLEQISPMADSLHNLALICKVIFGRDNNDMTTAEIPVEDYTDFHSPGNLKQIKIAVPEEFIDDGLDSQIKNFLLKLIGHLSKSNINIDYIRIPLLKYSIAAYHLIASAEAASNLARYDGIRYTYRAPGQKTWIDTIKRSRDKGFGDEVKRRIETGMLALRKDYIAGYHKALKIREEIKNRFRKIFDEYDFILSPATAGTAFDLGAKNACPDEMYKQDKYLTFANMSGLPAIVLPVMPKSGMPFGVQLCAPWFNEKKLFDFSNFLDKQIKEEINE